MPTTRASFQVIEWKRYLHGWKGWDCEWRRDAASRIRLEFLRDGSGVGVAMPNPKISVRSRSRRSAADEHSRHSCQPSRKEERNSPPKILPQFTGGDAGRQRHHAADKVEEAQRSPSGIVRSCL